MRMVILASVLSVLALGALVASPGSATAAKSKMGCNTGTEIWNAALGKCEPGEPKYKRKTDAAKQPAAKMTAVAKKAPAEKKAPAARKAPAAAK